jgi:hypothetical protein
MAYGCWRFLARLCLHTFAPKFQFYRYRSVTGFFPVYLHPMRRAEPRCNLVANSLRLWLVGYMLTRSEFVAWLRARRCAGHSLTAIGRDMGVSRQAVQQWLSGATQPSRMALMLGSVLAGYSRELEPGLPCGPDKPRKALRRMPPTR